MNRKTTTQTRRIAAIFWVMTALFVAQMGWWIIFQISHVAGDISVLERSLELQRYQALDGWRQHAGRLEDSLRVAWVRIPSAAFNESLLDAMPAWSEAEVETPEGRRVVPKHDSAEAIIGRLEIPLADGKAIIVMGPRIVADWITREFPQVRYQPALRSVRPLDAALTIDQLTIDPVAEQRVLDSRKKRVRMFVWEGSFFIVLIVLGAVAIHRALRQSVEFERRQQNFLAAVTHELKSPLASIRLFSETVSARELSDAKRREFMDKITGDAIRLEEMVDDVLDAAVLSRQSYHPQLVTTNLSVDLHAYTELYRARAERAGLRWEMAIRPDVMVRTDYRHMRRAIGAVLDNAIKYTQHAGTGKIVRIGLTTDPAEAIIAVTDEGIGLSPADQRHVFERFFRSGDELTRRVTGSGLGLYLAREIIEAHGGRILLTSKGQGRGAVVEIRLPLHQETDAKA